MITLAKDGMRPDLERIWRVCFPQDSNESVRYFFERKYNPNSCIVYIDPMTGRPASMIHVSEAYITDDSEIVPALYVHAAATKPDMQGRGIMTGILNAAMKYAQAQKCKYLIIAPRKATQFRFFEKRGFYRCFSSRVMNLTRRDMETLADYRGKEGMTKRVVLGDSELYHARRDALVDREGYVSWGKKAVSYAMGSIEADGGEIVATTEDYTPAYAFCRREGNTTVISEFIAQHEMSAQLCRAILDSFNTEIYSITVPMGDDFFAAYGDIADFGMIKALNGRKPTNLLTLTGRHKPYIGLAQK